ncbi:MAG TPA: cytochrome c [Bryobacteraceae bacterium]|nr:cytochrome c [Bryobacteraceae bacterium]
MSHHYSFRIVLAGLLVLAAPSWAQRGGRGGGGGAGGRGATARPIDITAKSSFDMASVERGGRIYAAQCASCHGADARGGKLAKTDSDLMRSELVVMDHSGRELPGFLALGRPDKGMPKFELSHDDGVDLATWLHYQVTVTVARQDYQRPNVFSGDPKAGEAFFNGPVGKCNTCHSVTGDLKGIGQKTGNDAGNMQASILGGSIGGGRGRGRGGFFGPGGGRGGAAASGNVTATVTLKSGEKFSGSPVLINDFVVEIHLPSGENKTWLRTDGWPQVTEVNRLQAHIDLMKKYTDDDIHNLAAYLKDK